MKKSISALILAVVLICTMAVTAFAASFSYNATSTVVWGTYTISSPSSVGVAMSICEKNGASGATKMKYAGGGLRNGTTYTQYNYKDTGYKFVANANNYIVGTSNSTNDTGVYGYNINIG